MKFTGSTRLAPKHCIFETWGCCSRREIQGTKLKAMSWLPLPVSMSVLLTYQISSVPSSVPFTARPFQCTCGHAYREWAQLYDHTVKEGHYPRCVDQEFIEANPFYDPFTRHGHLSRDEVMLKNNETYRSKWIIESEQMYWNASFAWSVRHWNRNDLRVPFLRNIHSSYLVFVILLALTPRNPESRTWCL